MPHRPRRWPLALVSSLVVITLGLGVFLAYGAHAVQPVSLAHAVREFRASPGAAGVPGWDLPLDGSRPPAGVYAYTTTGAAHVDTFAIDRRYPPVTARIVRHGPGCQWTEEVPIFAEHLESYSACATGGDQADTGFGTRLTYFLVPGVTSLACSPGGTRTAARFAPGESRAYSCRDESHGVVAEATATYGGDARVRVAGAVVTCRQVTIRAIMRGTTTGGAIRALCTLPDTGLVVRETRDVGVVVDSAFVGRVIYTEHATFTLRSLAPMR